MTVLGHDVQTHANQIRPRIGYVPENHYLYPWMTVDSLLRFRAAVLSDLERPLCRELLGLFSIDPPAKNQSTCPREPWSSWPW